MNKSVARGIALALLSATSFYAAAGNDSNLLIVFYVQIMPDDFVMQLHRF
ncbi:methionine ABC transporter substrate-binding protein [Klebsiella pneumoniae]|nr:methionine ABC transporter substrate-binding protein [Klebsiella pneumoniae]